MASRLIFGAAATVGCGGLAFALLQRSPEIEKASRDKLDKIQTLQLSKDEATKRAIERSTRIVERFKAEFGIPGLAVGVSVNGKQIFSRGFGYNNIEDLSACTEESVFRIASISKPITATLVAKLVQDGMIDLDAPIQKYVTDFPEKKFDGKPVQITTRHLLSHLGGIRHYRKSEATNDSKESKDTAGDSAFHEFFSNKEYKTVSEALEVFKEDPIIEEPGKKPHYTTFGFVLLSRIIEGATNDTFPNQLKQLTQSLSMHSTGLDENRPLIANRTRQYERKGGRIVNTQEVNCSNKWAGGGLLSTVGDLLNFGNAHLYSLQCGDGSLLNRNTTCCPHKALLTASSVGQFWNAAVKTDNDKHYGMGWSVQPAVERLGSEQNPWNATGFVSHGGGAVGGTTFLLVKPSQVVETDSKPPNGTCVVVLANLQSCKGIGTLALDLAKEFSQLE